MCLLAPTGSKEAGCSGDLLAAPARNRGRAVAREKS